MYSYIPVFYNWLQYFHIQPKQMNFFNLNFFAAFCWYVSVHERFCLILKGLPVIMKFDLQQYSFLRKLVSCVAF